MSGSFSHSQVAPVLPNRAVKFMDAVPTMGVTDVKTSLRFYVEGLGFEVEWVWPFDRMSKELACIRRGDVRLFLARIDPQQATPNQAITCSIFVDEIDILFTQLQARFGSLGLAMASQEPKVYPWGLKEFSIQDPDGHRVRFCDETFEVASS